jgi:hypothetical protein
MEGKNVREIYFMVVAADYLLAGGDPRFASFPDRMAVDAPVKACRDHYRSLFPVHQSPVYAPSQSPRRLILGDVP